MEGFWSLLKRGIVGIYHSVSAKHLEKLAKMLEFKKQKDGTYISKYGTEYEMKNTGFQIKKLLNKDGKFK